ncbi:MAG: error-prone DNA polymerase [Pseudomonadota bacterium]
MFAELSALSNFSFLTGASHPEEYLDRAGLLGLTAIAIADENSVAGIVRAYTRGKEITRLVKERKALEARAGIMGPVHPAPTPPVGAAIGCVPRLIPAAKLVLTDGLVITVLPETRAAWSSLSRLLSLGRRRAPKGDCELRLVDVLESLQACQLLLHEAPQPQAEAWLSHAQQLAHRFGPRLSLLMAPVYDGQDPARFGRLTRLAARLGVPTVASAAPRMHIARRRRMADVLTSVRTGTRVDDLGRAAAANAEQRLRSEAEMRRLFKGYEDAVDRAGEIAARCTFCLSELRYEYPSEVQNGEAPQDRLTRLTQDGLVWRYPTGVPERVQKMAMHELNLISKLGYAPYFLTVRDIVAFARSRDILCQGRGSAANSVVCFALGITSVSPEIGTMVFERFVSEARDEPPDIDVDFEHERREEVIQHIYERYGRHRAGLCATVIHYRGKRAVREVGRAMGLTEDTLAALSSQIWGFGSVRGIEEERLREIGLDPADRRLRQTIELIYEIQGFPRHLSQHVGGFVITEGRLDDLVPIENATMEDRTVICWDKDDIDSLGILKIDVLALGMLTCIRKAFDLMERHHGLDYTLATLPPEDSAVYDMLCRADSIGVFQVESRAQMNFLPRMRPRCFYDLVIQVAIVRPGPIQGDMVHPFIRRRNGEEEVSFPSDELGRVLAKTLGVPLFQEQAMQIAILGAGFDPSEADRLRRSLATFKKHGNVSEFRSRFLRGMAENGYERDFAERCFSQIEGFGSYGFPESHAASFALLVYASSWIKHHHPGIFACALLNAQPMGFYAPAQIVRDAREHGVEVRPVCINMSYWDNVMEPDGRGGLALRLGFRQIKGMSEDEAGWISAARGNGYRAVGDLWRRAGLPPAQIARLAEADAFAGLGLNRREALWEARALKGDEPLPLFAGDLEGEGLTEPAVSLPPMSLGEEVVEDFVSMRLSLRAHPVALLRHMLTPGLGDADLAAKPDLRSSAGSLRFRKPDDYDAGTG